MKSPRPSAIPLLYLLLLACRPFPARAHAPEESTTVARLQHERLEITVTLSAQMAGALVRLPTDTEADTQEINESNFETYRARLQEKAPDLLEVFDGGAALLPTRTQVILNKLTEPTFLLFYPQPKEWPLRLRVRFLGQLPAGYGGTAEVFDDNETLLGRRTLGREGAQAELSVRPAAPPPSSDAPLPETPAPSQLAAASPVPISPLPSPPRAALAPPSSPRAGIAWVALALASAAILFLGLKRTK